MSHFVKNNNDGKSDSHCENQVEPEDLSPAKQTESGYNAREALAQQDPIQCQTRPWTARPPFLLRMMQTPQMQQSHSNHIPYLPTNQAPYKLQHNSYPPQIPYQPLPPDLTEAPS